ncbi:MAG: hypothetical protein D6767_00410 [Candidatus Hydrogenedentota bacterium]|nr:MAG: hypothetical protein D6767_00410 [Candidatus Hydrogenedentota bacterium]
MSGAGQFIDNLLFIIFMALIIEVSLSAILSIKLIKPFFETDIGKTIRDILIILIAFGFCTKVPSLKIFYKVKVSLPASLNLVLSALLLARFVKWFHDWIEAAFKAKQS